MREFNLVSVDWDSVRLMQAGQFKQETFYQEELVRWTLQRGRIYGLLHLDDNGIGRPSPEGGLMYSVAVHGCIGVAEQGHIIEIPEEEAVRATIEANTQVVPLYVGVSILQRAEVPELYPTMDGGLLQCRGRRPQYHIAADNSDESIDWLQIGQFVKTPGGLSADPDYIPECLFLSSHAGQWRMQQEIQSLAAQALNALEKHSTNAPQVFATAAALAGPLGPAARTVDVRQHPHAYVDRLAGIFMSQRSQLRALPNPNLTVYQQALDQLDSTLAYLESDWTMGQALKQARECFERLLRLYEELLQKLAGVAPAPERRIQETDVVVPAPAPGTRPEETPAAPGQRRGVIWRR